MTNWILWFMSSAVVVILEMFTGTFYLLMIGIGLAAGGLAALAGIGSALQFIIAAMVGILAIFVLRNSRLGTFDKTDSTRDRNINLDIGETITVAEWQHNPGGMATARVMYRGAMWDIELEAGATAQSGSFIIRELRGNRLIVANSVSSS